MRLVAPVLLVSLLLLGAATIAVPPGRTEAQDQAGSITGIVYHDLDGNGVRDPGELGMADRLVSISGPGGFFSDQLSAPDGRYVFSEIAPGGYTVALEPQQTSRICVGQPPDVFTFDPTAISFCVDLVHPFRATTPSSVPVTVGVSTAEQIDFGLQPIDVVTMAGYAILEDDFAPAVTAIEARFEGTECGRTEARPGDGFNMQLDVFGAGERPGCPTRNDLVGFLIGGVPTASEVRWVPFTETLDSGGFLYIGLIAIEQHAWYWTQAVVDVPPPDGTTVQAVVGDTACGEATTRSVPIGQGSAQYMVGFSRLIVPSAEIKPGCGRPDATVSFRLGGEEIGTVPWQPGPQEVHLELGASFTPAPGLPTTGSGGQGGGMSSWVWPVVLGALGVLALGAGAFRARHL
jgi:hypothetical protein